jgi:hypothetical protein
MRSNYTTDDIDFWRAFVIEPAMLAREFTWGSRGGAGIVVAEFPGREPNLGLVEVVGSITDQRRH